MLVISPRLLSLSLCVALGLAGCAAPRPAPVVDRAAARPAAASATEQAGTYTVKRGDTLYSVALEHGVDWRDVAAWNGISDPTRMAVGQVLRMQSPTAVAPVAQSGAVQVTPISTGPTIEVRPIAGSAAPAPAASAAATAASGSLKTEPKAIKLPYSEQNLALVQQRGSAAPTAAPAAPAAAGGASAPAPAAEATAPAPTPKAVAGASAEVGGVRWSWPAEGDVSAKFSDGGSKGVQIAGRLGMPVLAAADGKVTYVGDGVRGYGNLVIVKHNDMYLSVYAHNQKILVKDGQAVTRGQKIAEMGNGAASKPLLHFEIRRFGKPVDPMQFLPGAG